MSNGCGCQSGLLKHIRPPYAKKFYVPCCMHDDDYDRGGDKYSRLFADKMLFFRMMKTIIKEDITPGRTLWLVLIAYGYYIAVRLMGWRYYKYIIRNDDD